MLHQSAYDFPAGKQECSFSIDSRTIREGEIFVAFQGLSADGHDYLEHALQGGANGLIISDIERISQLNLTENNRQPTPFWVLQVEDGLAALQAIAYACRQKHQIPFAGVTGSNGKTTVKDMIASILGTSYQVLKSQKSFNNHIGLPLTLANMTEHHEVAVLEMGMNAPGEIARLAEIARPSVGLITNITCAHLGFFQSLEEIMRAKLELIQALPAHGVAVLNADDDLFPQMLDEVKTLNQLQGKSLTPVTFGIHASPTIRAGNVRHVGQARYAFELVLPDGEIPITLPLPGYHNVSNALAAVAVVYALHQVPDCSLSDTWTHSMREAIKEGLESFRASPMRMQVSVHRNITIINDAYNANPISMASGLDSLQKFPCQGKKIAVLGDMLELGDISESAHQAVGQVAARIPVDKLLLLGDYASEIAQGARLAGMSESKIFIDNSHEQLAKELTQDAQSGDVIFFKASRGIALENVIHKFLNDEPINNEP